MDTLLDEILTDRLLDEAEFEDDAPASEIVPPTDSRKRIVSTRRAPYQWICTVAPTFRHPTTGKEREMDDQPGTGFLIGPRHVLTAAHVLFPPGGPFKDQRPRRVRVTPGHDDASRPYGSYVSTVYRVRSEWRTGGRSKGDIRYDFALIELSRSILQRKLKYWGASGTGTFKFPILKSWLKGRVVNVCGYPRDKPLNTQWIAFDQLDRPVAKYNNRALQNVFMYKADSCVGQSGAPVWWFDGRSKRYLVGIHTGYCDPGMEGCRRKSGPGCRPGSSRWSHNRGVLFTHEVQDQINAWMT